MTVSNILRVLWTITHRFFYYSTALIVALLLTGGIGAGIAYYYYDNLYTEYLEIEQKWTAVDLAYMDDLNVGFENLDLLRTAVEETKFDSKEDKRKVEIQLDIVYNQLTDAEMSMTYEDKYSNYPKIFDALSNLKGIATQLERPEIASALSNPDKDNEEVVKNFNDYIFDWNEKVKSYPESRLVKVAHFKTWEKF